jgi:DNA-binding response OmpR family regulator
VSAAPDGEACLELADREQPQVILLDENLPGISGMEACRRLKASEGTRHLSVIMFIGKGSNRGVTAEAGALDYLVKPFRVEKLLHRVKAAISVGHLTEPIERLMAYIEALDENRTGLG